MKKNDVYLAMMIAIFTGVAALLLFIANKYVPLFFYKTVYVCRAALESVSFQEVPHIITKLAVYGISFYSFYIVTRLLQVLAHYEMLRRDITKKIIPSNGRLLSFEKNYPHIQPIHIIQEKKARAYTMGFFRRNIYVSTGLLKKVTTKELEAILLHEYKHAHDFDALKLFVAFMVEISLPFIPSLKDLSGSIRITREIHADEFAINIQKTDMHVLTSLKKMLRSTCNPQPQFAPSFAAEDLIDARLSSIMQHQLIYRATFSTTRLVLSIGSVLFMMYLLLTPLYAAEILVNGKSSIMTCSDNSRECLAVCEANASYLLQP